MVRYQRMADKTRLLTLGDSYHHVPTVNSVRRTRGGEAPHFHHPKSSHSQQNLGVEEEVATVASQVTIREWGKMT